MTDKEWEESKRLTGKDYGDNFMLEELDRQIVEEVLAMAKKADKEKAK